MWGKISSQSSGGSYGRGLVAAMFEQDCVDERVDNDFVQGQCSGRRSLTTFNYQNSVVPSTRWAVTNNTILLVNITLRASQLSSVDLRTVVEYCTMQSTQFALTQFLTHVSAVSHVSYLTLFRARGLSSTLKANIDAYFLQKFLPGRKTRLNV
jgi:hypothetical protein